MGGETEAAGHLTCPGSPGAQGGVVGKVARGQEAESHSPCQSEPQQGSSWLPEAPACCFLLTSPGSPCSREVHRARTAKTPNPLLFPSGGVLLFGLLSSVVSPRSAYAAAERRHGKRRPQPLSPLAFAYAVPSAWSTLCPSSSTQPTAAEHCRHRPQEPPPPASPQEPGPDVGSHRDPGSVTAASALDSNDKVRHLPPPRHELNTLSPAPSSGPNTEQASVNIC